MSRFISMQIHTFPKALGIHIFEHTISLIYRLMLQSVSTFVVFVLSDDNDGSGIRLMAEENAVSGLPS
jgi:hypothetical protein